MRRVAAIVAVGVWWGASAPAAPAADWSAKGQFRESIEASDNRSLRPTSPGDTYDFGSSLLLNLAARVPTWRFDADADISYRKLAGPGRDESVSPLNTGVRFKAEHATDALTKYYIAASWRRQDAVTAQLADNGIFVANGHLTTLVLDGGVTQRVSALDSVSLSVRGTSVEYDFTTPGASPYTSVLATGAWIRRLTPLTSLTTSLQVEVMDRDNIGLQTVFTRATVGVETFLTKRLTFKAMAGGGVQQTDGAALPPGADSSSFWIGDLRFLYKPLPDSALALFALHSVGPSALGQVDERTAAGLSWQQAINRSSDLTLSGEFVHSELLNGGPIGDSDFIKAEIAYAYRLTSEWQTRLSYRYAHRTDDLGRAQSNTIYFALVRDFVIQP